MRMGSEAPVCDAPDLAELVLIFAGLTRVRRTLSKAYAVWEFSAIRAPNVDPK